MGGKEPLTPGNNSVIDQEWMTRVSEGGAFFDWNRLALEENSTVKFPSVEQAREVILRSECLRDAEGSLLSWPTLSERMDHILGLRDLGVGQVTLGIYSSLPGELSESNREALELLEWMDWKTPELDPVILARATRDDLDYLVGALGYNPRLVGIIFQDLSEVRRIVEGWGSLEKVLAGLVDKIRLAKTRGLRVMAFTENLSITRPEDVSGYVEAVCEAGADWVGIADTAGRLFPQGAAYLTGYVKERIEEYKARSGEKKEVGVVFHGHDDLGRAVDNSLAALASGASVVDVVTNGLGERVGNTNLIEFVGNLEYYLRMSGETRFDLTQLPRLAGRYEQMTGTPFGQQQPLVGEGVFSTAFGIHGNYFLKVEILALNMREAGMTEEPVNKFLHEAWRVYSAGSPADLGRRPDIRVSHVSGAANVILRLRQLGAIDDVRKVAKDDPRVVEILHRAKEGWGGLADEVLVSIWQSRCLG